MLVLRIARVSGRREGGVGGEAEPSACAPVPMMRGALPVAWISLWCSVCVAVCACNSEPGGTAPAGGSLRWIDRARIEDKVRGSWVGQMVGVAWGAPTEFRFAGRIIPDEDVPVWKPSLVNLAYIQDDLYVEIPFLEAYLDAGISAGWEVMGQAFGQTRFPLWHANKFGRDNLAGGIAPPDSGHWSRNPHCDDIDWQIEADFAGTLCPGLVNQAIDIAWRAGHIMNHGDGVLGGVFVSAMHAAAFYEESLEGIVRAGRAALPEGSLYRDVVDDVIRWRDEGIGWEEAWERLETKWGSRDRCPDFRQGINSAKNIDAKLNGAYVLIGLLYGEGDLEQSMRIAMRCGQDSDCNPSTLGGILGNWMGLSGIPDRFTSELRTDIPFMFTDVTLDDAVASTLEIAREAVLLAGGAILGERTAREVWGIPTQGEIEPPILEQWPLAPPEEPPSFTARVANKDGPRVELEARPDGAGGTLAYEWYFGDLGRAKGARVAHAYAAAGAYEVLVCGSDVSGTSAWRRLSVSVP